MCASSMNTSSAGGISRRIKVCTLAIWIGREEFGQPMRGLHHANVADSLSVKLL